MGVAHRWIQCRYQPARRLLDLDTLRAAHVLIRLAIRDENELAVVQVVDKVEHGLSMVATAMPGFRFQQSPVRLADFVQTSSPVMAESI
jgi:hypothetical protein